MTHPLLQPGEEREVLLPESTSLFVEMVNASRSVEPAFIAARICYAKGGYEAVSAFLDELKRTKTPLEVEDYMRDWLEDKIVSRKHWGIFEHLEFSVAIRGISRACSHQQVRHRVASYAQQSQRYVEKGNFRYVAPPLIIETPEAFDIFVEAMGAAAIYYQRLTKVLFAAHPELNTPKKRELVFQDARFVLPNACETEIVIKMNGRAWIEASRHRLCNRAQWEIRAMFREITSLIRAACPPVGKLMGPRCRFEGCQTNECKP